MTHQVGMMLNYIFDIMIWYLHTVRKFR